ncbi:hypothetical protein [Flavisolibacter tropicus]|uniref:hypothetical protein n=1 Tax=Flavisolibacter tropicus TaxID=1492898 RepID=UPI0011E05F6E|nr:hypothetical protein [Flavisolibacter tropicus]
MFSLSLSAQIEYPIFKDTATFQAEDSGKLSLQIDNFNYLRNYEYFGDIPLGYTLIGYQFMPQLKYQLNKYFQLKGGIFLRREFGHKGFYQFAPVLTAKYQKKGFSLLIGTLEGALNHRFIEPIYDVENVITHRLEQGVQVLLNKKHLWLDWYVDWKKAIEQNSPYREELTLAASSRVKLINTSKLAVELPLQFMMAHKGGQIDASGLPLESLINSAVGASVTVPTNGPFLKAVRTEHYMAFYRDISGAKKQLYANGKGWYSSLLFKTKWVDIDARYWKGNQFYGPNGGALFSSISQKIAGYGEENRELLFLSLIYDRQLFPNLNVDVRFEPYYDVRNKLTEYSYSLFLRFNKDFFLKRIK